MNSIDDVRQLEACYETTITKEHLDEYGHMNVKWYAQLWGWGASGFMNARGLDFVKDVEFGIGYWVLRQIIDYTAEVLEGDHITIYGRMVARTDKVMHNMYWMVNDTQNKIAATSQVLVGNAADALVCDGPRSGEGGVSKNTGNVLTRSACSSSVRARKLRLSSIKPMDSAN